MGLTVRYMFVMGLDYLDASHAISGSGSVGMTEFARSIQAEMLVSDMEQRRYFGGR